MEENRDIYKQPEKDGPAADLPAYESTPDEMRAVVRRKTVLFSLLLLGFGVFAALFAWNEHKKIDDKSGLRDMLHTPTFAGTPVVRQQPPAAREIKIDDVFTNKGSSANLSPQKMADAMAEIRAANQYVAVRDWDSAEAHLTNALAVWPDMTMALRMRGLVFTQRGQFDEAILTLERAIKLDPFNAEAFNTLATAYMQKKQFDRAEDLLQTSLSIQPGYAATQVNLGLLYILMTNYVSAIEQLEAAQPQMPDSPAIVNNIGVCLLRMNRHEEARQKFQDIVKRDPKHAGAYFNIALSYAIDGDVTNSVAWIRKGAAQCTPVDVQRFLTDQDFNAIRNKPEYLALLHELYPQLPRGPGT